jgi:potassium-transporting ATPase potassium-binding subunit
MTVRPHSLYALAGNFARQQRRSVSLATLPTDSPTLAIVIIDAALLVGALTFLPALALRPPVEQSMAR